MAMSINTNIASLNAQRNLISTQGLLNKSLQRLSSGLRINSAKDDAAGLAISDRMTSQIRGLNQAARNANDGISLAQTAEGALQESTNLLQRMRELAIQSANDSNSASDRASLQAEINQLQQELTRIAETTTFNSKNVLDGTLANALFHVGSEKDETISVSIGDARATALGSNEVSTENTNRAGIEAATSQRYIGGDSNAGTEIGVVNAHATQNGYSAETFTVTYTNQAGQTQTDSYTSGANDGANTIASNLTTNLDGVTASAFNYVTIDNLVDATGGSVVTLNDQTIATFDGSESLSDIATAINGNSTLQTQGVYAINNGTSITVYATDGRDLDFHHDGTDDEGFDITGIEGTTQELDDASSGAADYVVGGRLEITVEEGFSLSTAGTTHLVASPTATTIGHSDGTSGNNVGAQVLTVVGPNGSDTITVGEDASAYSVAQLINDASGTTGVNASARTTATLSSLSADGTVSFSLYGDNDTTAVSISATVTTGDLGALADAINDQTGETGITATLSSDSGSITLTMSTGKDIRIDGFQHSAAVDYQDPSSSAVSSDGSSVTAANEVTMAVTGGDDAGTAVTLKDGGLQNGDADSTVIGGEVTFDASEAFNISSSISGSASAGDTVGGTSLFSGDAGSANTSTLSSVSQVDISTQTGANDAISVIDGAIAKVDTIRGDLGAVQNRFESTIANLNSVAENISAARSRIMDADFAAETANLTKAQILQQAGTAMLAQANTLPQAALTLLQG